MKTYAAAVRAVPATVIKVAMQPQGRGRRGGGGADRGGFRQNRGGFGGGHPSKGWRPSPKPNLWKRKDGDASGEKKGDGSGPIAAEGGSNSDQDPNKAKWEGQLVKQDEKSSWGARKLLLLPGRVSQVKVTPIHLLVLPLETLS